MTATGSILLNGRRSASPDRRVTFGNIERYDIMTSNQMQKHQPISELNGSYAMSRLDNRIKKAIKLGFNYVPGDVTTYSDVVDFLLEFNIIANRKIISERHITNILQTTFHKIIVRQSAVHTLIYVNLENRSDEIVKEELVRVTTEPIFDPHLDKASAEAKAWMKNNTELTFANGNENEDEELSQIETQKETTESKTEKQEQTKKHDFPDKSKNNLPPPSPKPQHKNDVKGLQRTRSFSRSTERLVGSLKLRFSSDNIKVENDPPPQIITPQSARKQYSRELVSEEGKDESSTFNARVSFRKPAGTRITQVKPVQKVNSGKKVTRTDSGTKRTSFSRDASEKPAVRRSGSGVKKESSFTSQTKRTYRKKAPSPPASPRKSRANFVLTKPVSRAESLRNKALKTGKNNSETSSVASTPDISRENSTIAKITPRLNFQEALYENPEDQLRNEIVKIASAFQQKEGDKCDGDIDRFMKAIVKEDLEESAGNRLKLSDLRNHIRHRIILAKNELFENADITLDISKHFNTLFSAMASHFESVGCEISRDKHSGEKTCYLLHVKLVDYVDDLREISMREVCEGKASYV